VNAYIPEQQTDSEALFDLEILEAKRLLESLENLERDDVLRAHRVQELKALCERKRELHETNNKLDDLSVLSEEEREDYLARKKNREARIEELGSLKEKLDHLTREAGRLQSSIRDKERQISEQEKIVALSEKARKKVDLARTLRAMFEEYKKQLKARRRCQLEEAINRNFGLLMTSHKLIDSIEVEDDFALVYRDTNKETVGMANISAGMKQLAATSLLWALKQVSEKTVPLVIDTPLARLDRQHQENLLVQYYPKAGGQVIVLPTDSELDAHKYGLIQKHVYCEYRLNNPEGNMTKPVKAKMYE
jgi:DNA sulfur modification protein DndD